MQSDASIKVLTVAALFLFPFETFFLKEYIQLSNGCFLLCPENDHDAHCSQVCRVVGVFINTGVWYHRSSEARAGEFTGRYRPYLFVFLDTL